MKPACALGIDIGGSTTRAGILLADSGTLVDPQAIPTLPSEGGVALLARAVNFARELSLKAEVDGLDVRGIGIALAELVDLAGEPASAQMLPLRGLRVREAFAGIAPAVVDADSRAAALGEAARGAGRPFRTFLYVTVGTGISSAFVIDGVPHAGARGAAGTMASGPQTFHCSRCGGKSRTVLEETASGPALAARWRERTGRTAVGSEEVLLAAVEGNPIALEIVTSAAEVLGSAVGLLVNVLDPEAVIVGGGLGSAAGPFRETLVKSVREHVWSDLNRDLPILKAGHGALAGVVGAGLQALAAARERG